MPKCENPSEIDDLELSEARSAIESDIRAVLFFKIRGDLG